MLTWQVVTELGAIGGAVAEGLALWGSLNDWQAARREARRDKAADPPKLSDFIDTGPFFLVGLTRVVLGASAGFFFRDQIVGATAAIAVGAAGPALLAQLGAGSKLASSAKAESIEVRGDVRP